MRQPVDGDENSGAFWKTRGVLGDFAGGFFEEFVDECLVGFGLLGGHAAEWKGKWVVGSG